MKKKIFLTLILILTTSFTWNFYIEQKIYKAFSTIKTNDVQKLEYHSNKNFHEKGIENIGRNLQEELIKLNIN